MKLFTFVFSPFKNVFTKERKPTATFSVYAADEAAARSLLRVTRTVILMITDSDLGPALKELEGKWRTTKEYLENLASASYTEDLLTVTSVSECRLPKPIDLVGLRTQMVTLARECASFEVKSHRQYLGLASGFSKFSKVSVCFDESKVPFEAQIFTREKVNKRELANDIITCLEYAYSCRTRGFSRVHPSDGYESVVKRYNEYVETSNSICRFLESYRDGDAEPDERVKIISSYTIRSEVTPGIFLRAEHNKNPIVTSSVIDGVYDCIKLRKEDTPQFDIDSIDKDKNYTQEEFNKIAMSANQTYNGFLLELVSAGGCLPVKSSAGEVYPGSRIARVFKNVISTMDVTKSLHDRITDTAMALYKAESKKKSQPADKA